MIDAATAHAVIDAGAQFVISPSSGARLSRRVMSATCPPRPAASRRPRFSKRTKRGADIVKVFPATTLGPQYIKDVRAPLPQVKLMPTGGVTPDNAGDWIRAGAVAVAAGSSLLDASGDRERPFRRHYRERAAVCGERARRESEMSATVITFGELMLRLGPPGFERLLQSPMLVRTFGGGEANVAVSLAQFGLDSYYVTRLPSNAIGDAAVRALRAEGVATDRIVRGGSRMGIYFTETGASQRASTVLYDRANSAISEIPPDAVDWDRVMKAPRGFTYRHHAGARGEGAPRRRCGRRGRETRRRAHQRRPELPEEALDPGAGAEDDAAADARCGRRDRQRGRSAVRARHRRRGRGRDVGSARRQRLSRGRRARHARAWPVRWSRSRCARACRRAITAGARCCGTASDCTRASATSSGSSIGSAAATASPAVDLYGRDRALARRRAALSPSPRAR